MPIFARGVTKSKLSILFYLRAAKVDITREELYRVMLENDVMNFFDYQSCMHELEEDAFIAAVPKAFGQAYRVTVRGSDVLEEFVESLPVSLRDRMERYAREHREETLLKTQIVSDMEELPSGGYIVRLRALEGSTAVMELSLRVATRDMAQRMRANWEKASEPLYAHLLAALLKQEEDGQTGE
jgi:hypothetical protein